MPDASRPYAPRLPDMPELMRAARHFHTKKNLGQNFLIDPDKLMKIASALAIEDGERVLEIGPGLGFLTRFLLNAGAAVTAVELDQSAVEELAKMSLPGFTVVHGDFLRFDLGMAGDSFKVAGNVPYQITAPILARLFGEIGTPASWLPQLKQVVLTVQKEVAERIVARPGGKEYSQISLLAAYYSQPELIEIVEPECFFPVPKVTSAIVRLNPLARPSIDCRNPRLLRQIIHLGFRQRRKMLKNNLASLSLKPGQLESAWSELKLDPQARAEGLSLRQFAMLSDCLDGALKNPKPDSHNA